MTDTTDTTPTTPMNDMTDMNDMNDNMSETAGTARMLKDTHIHPALQSAEESNDVGTTRSQLSEAQTNTTGVDIPDENPPPQPPPDLINPSVSLTSLTGPEHVPTRPSRRQTARRNARAKLRPNHRRPQEWIYEYYDAWTRLTIGPFYGAVETQTLLPSQYARWVVDRTAISITILEAATRTGEMLKLRQVQGGLPLLQTAKENAEFMTQYAAMNGFEIGGLALCPVARRLTDVLEETTAPGASVFVALSVVWGLMLSCCQAWRMARRHTMPVHFAPIAEFLSRDKALELLLDTESILEGILTGGASELDYEKAGKAFEQVANRGAAVLDYTVSLSEGTHVPSCTCGRKGHYPSQCTFKSHI